MSIISKEGYEAKARYASNNARDNEEILDNEELSNKLDRICAIRHQLHSCNRAALYNTESSNFEEMWNIVELQTFAGEEVLDETNCPSDIDWSENIIDKEEYQDNYEVYNDYMFGFFAKKIEEINKKVEEKLRQVDAEYGTSYCPSGASRI